MDKVKIVAKNLLLTLVLLVVATFPLQIAIIITSLISMFNVSHITLYQPLAFALGLMGEGFVLFVLRQEFKGDKARLQQVMPFDQKGALIRYGTGYVLGTITFALLWGIAVLGKAFRVTVTWENNAWLFFVLFLVGFGIQGMVEEVIFRGYLQGKLTKELSQSKAILISALAFAVAHLGNGGISFLGFLNLTFFGVLMSLFRIYTGDLWLAGAFHSAWNFAEGPLFGTPVSGIVGTNVVLGSQSVAAHPLLNGGNFGIEASLLTFGGFILLIAFTYYLGQNYAKKSNRIEKII